MLEPSTTTRLVPSTLVIVMCVLRRFGLRGWAAPDGSRGRAPMRRPTSARFLQIGPRHRRVGDGDPSGSLGLRRGRSSPARSTRSPATRPSADCRPGSSAGSTRQSVHTNAWARLERNELSAAGFDAAFAEESAALGHRVPGRDVLAAARRRRPPADGRAPSTSWAPRAAHGLPHQQRGRAAAGPTERPDVADVMARFDVVVESSRGRGAQARAGVLRAGLRDARRSIRRRACSSTTSAST